MNSKRLFGLFSLSVLLSSANGVAQTDFWQKTNGPFGGPVSALATNSKGQVFCGTPTGSVFTSTDHGSAWSKIHENVGFRVTSIAIDSSGRIYLGIYRYGVLRSDDNGATWISKTSGLRSNYVLSVTINRRGTVFVGTYGGAFRSTNMGETWNGITSGLLDTNVTCFALSSVGELFCGTYGGVFRSTDEGESWTRSGLDPYLITSMTCDSRDNLYASTSDFGTSSIWVSYRAFDWRQRYLGSTGNLTVAPNGFVFATKWSRGILRSADRGITWALADSGLPSLNINCLAADAFGNIYAGSEGGGIYRSHDDGANWAEANTGFANLTISSLLAARSGLLFAGSSARGIFVSSDQGETWSTANQGISATDNVLSLAANSKGHLFAGDFGFGVYRSLDTGRTWVQVLNKAVYCLAIDSGDLLFAGGYANSDVFRSTDRGNSWSAIRFPSLGVWTRSIVASPNGSLLAASFAGLFRSTDQGTSWTQISSASMPKDIFSIAVAANGDLLAGGYQYAPGVLKSTDDGISWISTSLTSARVTQLIAGPDGTVLAVAVRDFSNPTTLAGVFRSTDHGSTWTQVSGDELAVRCLLLSQDGHLYAGTTEGVWRSSQRVTSINKDDERIPSSFALKQNYPNPFNPSTTIEFSIPRSDLVTLKVFDLLGEEVATLVNEIRPSGTYKVEWNAARLPSGVYFYRLQASDFTETKKLILLR